MLWISPKPPFPERDGATRASGALLRSLYLVREKAITLACVQKEQALATEVPKCLNRLKCFPPESALFALLRRPLGFVSGVPSFLSFASPKLAQYCQQSPHKIWVIDGLHAAAAWWNGKRFCFPTGIVIVYRAHNVETEIAKQRARSEATWSKRQIWRIEAQRIERAEKALLQQADHTFAISDRDKLSLESQFMVRSCSSLPIPYSFKASSEQLVQRNPTQPFLFVGRLDWQPNQEGLLWLLREVWPQAKLRNPEIQLVIAGIGKADYFGPLLDQPGVEFLGKVPSVEPLYARCRAAIIPVFSGSGVRVKALEACAFGVPMLSTNKGIEGLDIRARDHFEHAESIREWVDCLTSWDDAAARIQAQLATQHLSAVHDPLRLAETFSEVIARYERAPC